MHITSVDINYSDNDSVKLVFDEGKFKAGYVDFIKANPDTIWGEEALAFFLNMLRLIKADNLLGD